MTFHRSALAIALCLAWFSLASQRADADIVLAFAPSNSVNVNVNDVIDVPIYFVETAPIAFSPQGLKTFGFEGVFTAGIALEPTFPGATSFQFDSAFASAQSFTSGAGVFNVSAEANPLNSTVQQPSILLGTVRLKAVSPGTSTLTLRDPNVAPLVNGFSIGTTGIGIDSSLFAANVKTYTFTVNAANIAAVPEPGSMSLVALAGGGLWWANRRRRRAQRDQA